MRVDGLLVIAAALLFGACAALSPSPSIAAALLITLLLLRRCPARILIIAWCAFALSAWRARRAMDEFDHARIASRDALGAPSRCEIEGRVVTSPVLGGDALRYTVELSRAECEGRSLPVPRRALLYGGPPDLARGDVIEAVAQLGPVQAFRNLGLSDPAPGMARREVVLSGSTLSVELKAKARGWRALIDRARSHARRRILLTFAPQAAPLARALVLGESDLEESDAAAFKKSGLSHLLAVSGTHLVFAVVALVRALTALLVRIERLAARMDVEQLASGFGIGLALLYADFSGGTGSAWRAAWMLAAAFVARAVGRRAKASRTLAASLLMGAWVDPLAAFDISFLLSAAATSGILLLSRPLAAPCAKITRRPLRYLGESIATTVSAMLPCAPLLALMSPDMTLAGIIANVLAAPFGEAVALPVCLAHPLLSMFPPLEQGAALVGSGALLVVRGIAHASAASTWLALKVPLPGSWHLAVLAVACAGALLAPRTSRFAWLALGAIGLLSVELATIRAGNPRGVLRITTLDVGQGDATLVDLPDGRLMLIDGGGFVGSPVDPGRSVILPLLRARRRERVDIVVLSHPHPDHFGGLATTVAGVEVGEFWDSGQGESEGAGPVYAALLKTLRARNIPIVRPDALCRRLRHFASASLEVLGPCPRFVPGRDANDNSLVLRIEFGKHVVLLTGDAEQHQESELVAAHGRRLRADFLKVGHHGSRTSSTSDFLRHVQPQIATISCGVRNRFGHPHGVALERLSQAGVLALRLDRTGQVIWQSDGRLTSVRAFRLPR